MAVFKAVAELTDVVSHVIFCNDDSSLMLTLEANTNEFWVPSSRIENGSSWIVQSSRDLEDLFVSVPHTRRLLRLYKIWIPQHTENYIYHCIYFVPVAMDLKKKSKSTYGRYRGKVRWVLEAELMKMLNQETLRSPELMEFYHLCKGSMHNMLKDGAEIAAPTEFIYSGVLVEITDRVLMFSTASDSGYDQMVESASFTKEVQMGIYREYIFLCYPAMYMCQQVFSRLLMQLGWSREDAPFLFKAADTTGRSGLSFKDFLYILAALEPSTSHGGSPAELRCRYMFKFFDRDKDNALNFTEFKTLVAAIRRSKKQTADALSVNQEAEMSFKALGLNPENNTLLLGEFLRAVGELKLRGTSQIFRSQISMLQYLQELQDRESKSQNSKPIGVGAAKFEVKPPKAMGKSETGIQKSGAQQQPKTGKNADYELGVHTIRLQKSGTLITIDQIWNVTTAVSHSSTQQATLNDSYRRHSQDQFNQTSITNEVLKSLRYLMQINKIRPQPGKNTKNKEFSYVWGQLDNLCFGRNLVAVCQQVKEIFKAETRLIEISSPAYVMGDLHGNFHSLLYFEKILWHLGPALCPCNLLFLGDYVDRGSFGIEVIAYLFCYKIQTPGKMMLLRGNHEIRDIQKMFSFYTECMLKFGDKLGAEIWNAVNLAFDTMPIAASLDGKIFCCHGGIPPPWLCPNVQAINAVPCPLSNPDEQSSLAWEIMWNDPISKPQQVTEEVALELAANEGFAVNKRRGTAHIFSTEALERFLSTNGFSHIIRAHEVAQAGFNVLQKGKLLTVFSSSKYCGGVNEAACILADQQRLRVLRLEPS